MLPFGKKNVQERTSDLAKWINKKDIRSNQRAIGNGKKDWTAKKSSFEVKKCRGKMRIAKSQAELDLQRILK